MITNRKNAILLHGLPSKNEYYNSNVASASNAHWFPWLQNQLLTHDIETHTPEVFKVYNASYADWVKEIERYDINEASILVGHSMGAGFWVRYLSEHPNLTIKSLILVAPWLNVEKQKEIDFEDIDFFTFKPNPQLLLQANKVIIYSSDNDMESVKNSVKYLEKLYPDIKIKSFHNYGHFTSKGMQSDKFPELLEECLYE